MLTDERFMRRALQLALNGELDASPNPMVGAVIVSSDNEIIGEGWHRRCGEGHAEVNAIASVSDETRLTDSTMYVTLEPCAHYGKTPPCASLIIDRHIPRVVVGCADPFAKVAGRGIAMLRAAGIEVEVGMLEDECRSINRKFMTAHRERCPFITLKWAQSADGFIDGRISTPLTSMMVHRLRATHDAILVGSGTAISDNPSLDTRLYAGRSPLKVVLDRRHRLKLPELKMAVNGETVMLSDYGSLVEAMSGLYERGVTSVLVEGGSKVIESFIAEELWNEIRIETSPNTIEGHVKAPDIRGIAAVPSIYSVDGHKIAVYNK